MPMQINISGHHLEITPALKTFIEEKLQQLQKKFPHITTANVLLKVDNITYIAEGIIHVDRSELYAKEGADDMYQAIDILIDKLHIQLKKHKDKITDHR